jgi:NAD(P)-dependent dehydrogenase (short-subunit alcohol dehydrogenase family)
VTGGARGTGRAIALAYSRAGAAVVIADIDAADGALWFATEGGGVSRLTPPPVRWP